MDKIEIDSLDIWDKFKVWCHYMIVTNARKHYPYFDITPMVTLNQDAYNCLMYNATKLGAYNWPFPESHQYHDYADKPTPTKTKFLWSNEKVISFTDWIDPVKNTHEHDAGEDWDKHYFAQRRWNYYTGIYDWYWKFKDEIFK